MKTPKHHSDDRFGYKEVKKKRWKPKLGQRYYSVNLWPDIYVWDYFWAVGSKWDKEAFELHNVFRTEKQAQAALERVKAALKGE